MSETRPQGCCEPDTPLLDLRDVCVAFGGNRAVDGVSFQVAPGRVLALIGPNGAGKTTVLNLINGQYRASGGSIRFLGRRIGWSRRGHSGILRSYQDAGTFLKLTAIENVMVPLVSRGVTVKHARILATDALARLGLTHVADLRGDRLSGGQRKLVDFARCINSPAALVLLDEPSAGVHPELIKPMVDVIRRKQRSDRTSFVIISHDLPWVFSVCEHVVCMARGRVLAQGEPSVVSTDPRVREAYL